MSRVSVCAGLFSEDNRQTRGPALLDWDPSVRAAGMGGAFVGVADDSGALFWNPAGLGQIPRSELAISYAEKYGDQTRGDLRYVRPVWWAGERRSFGLRAAYFSVEPFDLVEEGATTGRTQPQEFLLSASYAQPVGPVSVGGSMKAIRQDISVDSASTWAVDAGVLGGKGRFRWGSVLTNWGPSLKTSSGSMDLPFHLRVGSGYKVLDRARKKVRDQLLVSAQIDAPAEDSLRLQAGTEYSRQWGQDLAVSARLGYHMPPGADSFLDRLTYGFGFSRESLGLNYTYLPQSVLGDSHRLEVTLRFGVALPQEVKRDELLKTAEHYFHEKRMVRARAEVEKVLVLSPGNYQARVLKRKIEALYSHSLDPETLMVLGEQAFNERRWAQSADFFRKVAEVNPDHAEARVWLERAEEMVGAERLMIAEKTLKDERRREEKARRRRAEKLEAEKKWVSALSAWRKVLEMLPQDTTAQTALARCRQEIYAAAEEAQRKGDLAGALDLYRASQEGIGSYRESQARASALEKTIATRRSEESRDLYEKGMAAYSAGDLALAQRLFLEVLRLTPDDAKAKKALERLKKEKAVPRP